MDPDTRPGPRSGSRCGPGDHTRRDAVLRPSPLGATAEAFASRIPHEKLLISASGSGVRPTIIDPSASMELRDMTSAGNDGAGSLQAADKATEKDRFLQEQNNGSNGEMLPHPQTSSPGRTKNKVWSRVRLWMVVLCLVILIIAVISISVTIVCSVTHEDEDEKFDKSLFTVSQYFTGSFELSSRSFTDPSATLSSAPQQPVEEMLGSLFRASPALGRYFSKADVSSGTFRNGSFLANYQLEFLVPEEDKDQLERFPVSRETVYNVFRQFLYDQEPRESAPLHIDPASLSMF